MRTFFCNTCGKELPGGSLRYVIDIAIFADFDGIIKEPKEDIEEEIKKLLNEMEEIDPTILEEDVFQEISIIVCKECKDKLQKTLFYSWRRSVQEGVKATLH
ncbi:MAG: hypothetical protein ACE5IH_00120 [Thermodesulfobacteriota bacterium]